LKLVLAVTVVLRFGDTDLDVPAVRNVMPQRREPLPEPSDPERRGPHVHAATRRSQIHRASENLDVGHVGANSEVD
jgi:hypothetical protein